MKDVVRTEKLNLLEVGIIYPIADNRWVNPVDCVPKEALPLFLMIKMESMRRYGEKHDCKGSIHRYQMILYQGNSYYYKKLP